MRYGNNPVANSFGRPFYWKGSGNTKVLKRIRQLLEAIKQNPFEGIGKPEALNTTGQVCSPVGLTKNTDLFTK